jgi:hypothetical protein
MRSTSKFFLSLLLIGCVGLTGCYQAKVTTNKSAGNKVVEKKWASSFVYGLVPAEVDVSDQCSNGIASAQRKFSFVNMLVNGLTFGLYLPQNVTVTCASGSMAHAVPSQNPTVTLPSDATEQEIRNTLSSATLKSVTTDAPIEVRVATK